MKYLSLFTQSLSHFTSRIRFTDIPSPIEPYALGFAFVPILIISLFLIFFVIAPAVFLIVFFSIRRKRRLAVQEKKQNGTQTDL